MFSLGASASYEFDSDYRGMFVNVPRSVLNSTLDALVGSASRKPLRFDLSVDLRRLLLRAVTAD